MGRSQESFSKKENEKKKEKKRKDKEKKKEERRMDSGKGSEEYAWVDENGNLVSAPPDPLKREEVNAEDIVIGISRREDVEEDPIRTGTVSFFNESKGYGFIKDHVSQEGIFVHINNVKDQLREGMRVSFEIERGPRGLSAVNVKLA
jgi:cold shock CspA family protein